MVMQKNNMHDTDTFEFFKYIIKMFIAVYLASHAFEFSMAVFDVAQNLVKLLNFSLMTTPTVVIDFDDSIKQGAQRPTLLQVAPEKSDNV